MAMEPPTALEPQPISEEKNKVFRSMLPIQPADVVRGQYAGGDAQLKHQLGPPASQRA